MKPVDGTCPPESVLSDFGVGKLDTATADTVSQHLETCSDCRNRVASVSGDSFVGRLKQAGGATQPAVRRERTYVPGKSVANAASSTDGSLSISRGLSRSSAPADCADSSPRQNDAATVSAPPELANHPDYELVKELGQGGMGTVYLARNRLMDRLEVLKVVSKSLLDRPGALERFQQEIRSAAKLNHANIVRAYSVLRPGDLLVFAMEYVRGQDLSDVVKKHGPLPVANAAFYVHQVALGLQHAHEKGMVHRDIKPNNLMLTVEGKKHVVKILDFGLSKATSEKGGETGLTKSGQMLGTPDYVAPEQMLDAQRADIRADIYSLGCTLYFMLTGGPPFPADSLYEVLEAHHKRDPRPLNLVRPEVPVELAAVVGQMMAKKPEDRYQTPGEVAKALVLFFKPGQSAAQTPTTAAGHSQFSSETLHGTGKTNPIPPIVSQPRPLPIPVAAPVTVATVVPPPAHDSFENLGLSVDTLRPAAKKQSRWSSLPPWQRWFGLGSAAAALLLGIVLLIRTPRGTIEIELTDKASVTVTLDGNHIDITGLDSPLSLDVGEHSLTVKGAGYEAITRRFMVTRGKNAPLRIALVPRTGGGDEKRNERGGGELKQSGGLTAGTNDSHDAAKSGIATILKAIERPPSLGVVAEKLVIHNAHSAHWNNLGTLECNVKLLADGREIWSKQAVAVPWAANEDRSVTLPLPPERFDRVRIEITKWEQRGGGLAEIQVFDADGRNLALGCPALSSGSCDERNSVEHTTDGVATTAEAGIGAWYLPRLTTGWVEVDLSLPRPTKLEGVTADKLVIWNQHNGPHNNSGTKYCDVVLFSHEQEVWRQNQRELPWAPDQDLFVELQPPNVCFDRLRIGVTPREGQWAGLAEVQVLSARKNLAQFCQVIAPSVFDRSRSGSRVTDGIVSSQSELIGYWLLPRQNQAGSVEIDLACLDPTYGAACRQLGLALALVDGDWQRGLLWLARGDEPALRRLAFADSQADSHFGYGMADQLALGDEWWKLAQKADGPVKERLLARSMLRYRQALDKLSGSRKAEVQARIDQSLPELADREFLYFLPETELKLNGPFRAPVSVNGAMSFHGLWLHPPESNKSSYVAYHLGKRYRRLHGAAAINDSAGGLAASPLTFRVVGDSRELWKSHPLKAGGSSEPFDINVAGFDKLELFVDCPGSDNWCHAVWLEPRLEPEPSRSVPQQVDSSAQRVGDKQSDPPQPPVAEVRVNPASDGFVSLFNGKDLAGWKTHPSQPGNWRVENGVLISSGPAVSHLYSERGNFTDFHLRVEARINDGGDSGVAGRASFGPVWPAADPEWPTGYETQIDCSAVPGVKTGSIWKERIAASTVTSSGVPPNEWFVLELFAVDNHIIVKINGQRTAIYTDEDRSFPMGHIVLQQGNPQTIIEFRKIELMERDVSNTTRAAEPPSAETTLEAAKTTSMKRRRSVRPRRAVAPFNTEMARSLQDAWASQLGVPVQQENSIDMPLILIPPGEFTMGSSPQQVAEAKKVGEQGNEKFDPWTLDRLRDEAPAHRVTISRPYLIGMTEVTVGQFRRFVEATSYVTEAEQLGGGNSGNPKEANPNNRKLTWRTPGHAVAENSNVSQVTWHDAVAFCNWLSESEKLAPCYRQVRGGWLLTPKGQGYRLPTEAEWEYACRAGSATQYSFGDDPAKFDQYGWSYSARPLPRPLSVAVKLPNAFGLHDMHGNVYEWCQDWFASGYYAQSPATDPTGPPSGSERVRRGGSGNFPLLLCRSAFRAPCPPVWRYHDLGFRVVRVSTDIARRQGSGKNVPDLK